jgi:hypothetical protein
MARIAKVNTPRERGDQVVRIRWLMSQHVGDSEVPSLEKTHSSYFARLTKF